MNSGEHDVEPKKILCRKNKLEPKQLGESHDSNVRA
jgi:hypothetical protein